jgi:hypothetical protein
VKRVKLIWLAGLATFALTAIAVTTASASAAEPEWGHCVPVKSKGHYEDKNCSKENVKESKSGKKTYKGKFEWDAGAAAACFAQKHGKYKDAGCTELDEKKGAPKGKYEKTGGPKFEGNGGAGVLSAPIYTCENESRELVQRPREGCQGEDGYNDQGSAAKIECEKEHATGEATASNEVSDISVRFTGCTFFGVPAQTHGLPAGEIQTASLKGRLGYINKATHEVGLLLEPASAGAPFATFEVVSGAGVITVGVGNPTSGAFWEEPGTSGVPSGGDGVISPITPVGQMTHAFTQDYRIEEKQVPCPPKTPCFVPLGQSEPQEDLEVFNVPSRFEGGALKVLEDELAEPSQSFQTEWAPAGQEITNVNTLEGEAEIKG